MKTVFDNDMVAHTWAQQSQDHGRNAKDSFYFRGPTIYSYRDRYPIGHFIDAQDGIRTVLIWSGYYGVTTSAHTSRALRATSHYRQFRVPYVVPRNADDHKANLADLVSTYEGHLRGIARAKSYAEYQIQLTREARRDALAYAAAFGLGAPDVPEPTPEVIQAALERSKAASARKAAEERERKRLEALELANKVREWQNGALVHLPWDAPTILRLKRGNPDVTETSRGAEFPTDHARKAWPLIRRLYERGEEFQRNGRTIHLGHFQIDLIEADGTLHAGCHTLMRAEVERFAATLGLEPVRALQPA